MRRLARLIPLALIAIPALAVADAPTSRSPGVQVSPPEPEVRRPPLEQQRDGRGAVRGCPVDQDCRSGHERLIDFELEAFPPPGGDPWITQDASVGGRLIERAPVATIVERPSELRPDLPWLDDLELPDLPVRWDRRVIDYLVFYKEDKRGRNIMRGWLEAQGQYKDMIVEHLRAGQLPEDLLYISMIESSYDPYTYSRAGASGLWQFMPEGGKIYGLEQSRWIDERNDPIRATVAVLDYFRDLHQRFGDWHLALAAFNAGYGAVIRSIARYNTNDFWQLLEYENGLPWESSIYVPKALAAAIVGHNRKVFGFDDVKAEAADAWDDVEVPTSVTLAVIARAAGCTAADLKHLNPHLLRGRTPPGRKYIVRVPAGGGKVFAKTFPQLRGDWDSYDAYVVAHGERFEDVATQFGLSRRKLMALNELDHESDVSGGTMLVVPRVSDADRKANLARAREDLYASGVDQKKGEPLIVPVPDKDAEIDGARRVFYRVVTGDELAEVAQALDVKVKTLARWNGVEVGAKLHPRMILQAWVAPDYDPERAHVVLLDETRILVVTRGSKEHLELAEARVGRERFEYTATKQETYADIAKKYGLSDRDLARINRKSHKTVVAKGETVIVYRVVDKERSKRAKDQWDKAPRSQKKGGKKAKADAKDVPKADAKKADAKDAKDAKADAKDAKKADAKDAKDAKADAKQADAKDAKADAKKADAKDAKDTKDTKADAKQADAKKADAKKADAKKADAKDAKDTKADAKKADAKQADAKQADADAVVGPVASPSDL